MESKDGGPANPFLTTRLRRLIEKIRDSEEQELVCAHPGGWWVGNDRVFAPDCFALLRLCLIRMDGSCREDVMERYTLSPDALEMLKDTNRKPEIYVQMAERFKADGKEGA